MLFKPCGHMVACESMLTFVLHALFTLPVTFSYNLVNRVLVYSRCTTITAKESNVRAMSHTLYCLLANSR